MFYKNLHSVVQEFDTKLKDVEAKIAPKLSENELLLVSAVIVHAFVGTIHLYKRYIHPRVKNVFNGILNKALSIFTKHSGYKKDMRYFKGTNDTHRDPGNELQQS